jgi:hypothetical protein
MANEFARNLKDAGFTTTFTLPASASSSTNQTTPFDFGADTYKPENVEIELAVPALTDTMVPNTRTVTYIIETCTATNFSTIDQTLYSEVFTGAGSGIAAKTKRVRLPSPCARYVRGKVTLGASTTDSSAISATVSALY